MRRKAIGLAAALVVLSLISVAIAQSRRTQPPAIEQAHRALIEGRYDQVAGLLEKLDAQDPIVVGLIARADIARGRYAQAEAALRPVAQRAQTSDAALQLGLLLKMLGRDEATAILTRVSAIANTSTDPTELARGARALRAIGRFYEANAAYRDAAALAPVDPAINAAWGDLFLETYNTPEALKSYQIALNQDPRWEPALVGSARTLSEEDPTQAIAIAKTALEINPSDVAIHVFLAEQSADAGHRDEARASLQKALEINPSSLEAHALLAGLAYVEDKIPEFEAEVAKVLAIAPNYGEVYRVAGELTAHAYRFDEAVTLVRRALTVGPRDGKTLVDLGIHLLRTGDEASARSVLEEAFKLDGFNVVTKNLLTMMDTLDTFTTIRDGDLVLRMPKDEAPVLADYALPLSHLALKTMAAKYEFTPRGPILIEMFSKHDDFAVRNVGLPGMVGALGACFGRVVTLDSPRALPPGEFQWEATLWHELTHVITLQMSNQRLPRWLSEGASTYEEKLARAEWARGMDMQFASLLARNEILKLHDLNAAFNDGRTISLAYFQAGILVEHIVSAYGQPGLNKLIRAYGQGLDTDAALKSALNTDLDALQAGFDQTVERLFGKLRTALAPLEKGTDLQKMTLDERRAYAALHRGSYAALMALGDGLRDAKLADEAVRTFEQAAALAPMATGNSSPHAQIVEIAMEKKDTPRAIAALQAVLAADFDNIQAARMLAGLMKASGVTDPASLRPVYQRIVAIDPFDAEAHTVIGRLAMQTNQPEAAVRAFKTVVALKPVDPALAYTDLAESYFKSGNRAEARRQTLAALEIAPGYERAQDLLLTLAEGRP